MENFLSWELNVPRENLKGTLLKLVAGPNSNDYPTVSKWSCSFIRYEHYRFSGPYWSSSNDKEQFHMSFDDYFDYLEKSVYEQSWNIGKDCIDFYDDNQTTSILRISYIDVNTSQPKSLLLYFCGFAQPYWRTNLRLATFRLEEAEGIYSLLYNETIGATLFILEALNVTFGGQNYGAYRTQVDWIKEALETNKNHLSYDYLQWANGNYSWFFHDSDNYYDGDILIIGNQLIDYFGLKQLRKAKCFAKWERPDSLFLFSSPNNLYEIDGRSVKIALEVENYYGGEILQSMRNRFESQDINHKHSVFVTHFEHGTVVPIDFDLLEDSPIQSLSGFRIKLTIEEEGY